MSKAVSRTKLRSFAYDLRGEAMVACQEAHDIGNTTMRAAKQQEADTLKNVAARLEAIIGGSGR